METQKRDRLPAMTGHTLATWLREWRGERSVYRAAHDLDVPVSTYQSWEDGNRPRKVYLKALAADIGVSYEQLTELADVQAAA